MPNFTGKSGGGPSTMKMYGKGKNPITMSKNMVKGPDGKMVPDYAVDGKGANDMKSSMKMYDSKKSMAKMYDKKSPTKKYKSDAQRKAVHASKAEKKSMAKLDLAEVTVTAKKNPRKTKKVFKPGYSKNSSGDLVYKGSIVTKNQAAKIKDSDLYTKKLSNK
jgi:hypothetical protein